MWRSLTKPPEKSGVNVGLVWKEGSLEIPRPSQLRILSCRIDTSIATCSGSSCFTLYRKSCEVDRRLREKRGFATMLSAVGLSWRFQQMFNMWGGGNDFLKKPVTLFLLVAICFPFPFI